MEFSYEEIKDEIMTENYESVSAGNTNNNNNN